MNNEQFIEDINETEKRREYKQLPVWTKEQEETINYVVWGVICGLAIIFGIALSLLIKW